MTPSVELKKVTKRFGDVVAVDAVDLCVKKGEFFSLLGPSGCGKTTTLRLVSGLERPNEGEVLINDQRVNDTPPYERDACIVFQNLALFPHMDVAENVAFGLKLRNIPRERVRSKVDDVLELVQLSGLHRRRPHELSGGQQQRVALARALVLRPEVLLLDEPLAALDRKLRKEMQAELRAIQKDVGTTFIYVTHDQKEALSMSERVAVMKDGAVVQLGSPAEIYERPRTRFVADFMGATNVFQARVVRQDGQRLQLQTAEGLALSVNAPAPTPSAPAQTLSVSVRPEAVGLQPAHGARPHEDNAFRGRVVSSTYLGGALEVDVALACGRHLTAQRGTASPTWLPQAGQEVWACWRAADGNVLAD